MLQNRRIDVCEAEHLFGTARQPHGRFTSFFHSLDGGIGTGGGGHTLDGRACTTLGLTENSMTKSA